MIKVCLNCYEIYQDSLKEDDFCDYQFCPKISCHGEVIKVDELMLPTIIELNKKGYKTKYCCSGHYYYRPITSYIMFEEGINIPCLPKGYILEEKNTIRKKFAQDINLYNYKYFELITSNANLLLKWSKSLPFNNC